MAKIPRDRSLSGTLALLRDGYEFIPKRRKLLQTDIFETSLMLRKFVCLSGEEAARLFYDEDRFERRDAAPSRLKKTLFGTGGVQGLDDEAHRRRKRMFMSLMTPENINRLSGLTAAEWGAAAEKWERAGGEVVLFDEAQEILCRAVCAWANVPLAESEVKNRTNDLAAMIEASGAVGWRHWRGRFARKKSEKWMRDIIKGFRAGKIEAAEASALRVIAEHRDLDGKLLDEQTAAVELINILRPTVAVARFITFGALALYEHPECPEKFRASETGYAELFAQEVRRFYPFFPFVAARVRKEFDWKGYRFPKGRRVILDLYGTNHDERLWDEPKKFQPERFRRRDKNPFDFIPQGGGDYFAGHRCAGEFITIELVKTAMNFLARAVEYAVPKQDLSVSLRRIPAIPKSRFVIENVKRNFA
jgi:fatty-acid peroxygenase